MDFSPSGGPPASCSPAFMQRLEYSGNRVDHAVSHQRREPAGFSQRSMARLTGK